MPDENIQSQVASRIETAITRAQEELPALSSMLGAFKELLKETALFKLEIDQDESFVMPEVDSESLRQGVPLVSRDFFRISEAQMKAAADRINPAIEKGFPKIASEVRSISDALNTPTLATDAAVAAVVGNQEHKIEDMARSIGVNSQVLSFVLGRLIRPFAEKRAEWMSPACKDLDWTKGYCRICGSWPSLSFLMGKEGHRWLKCSFCAHEWRFMRTACPFCGNEDQQQLEFLFSEDRKAERVEVCHSCKRYIAGIDLRDRVDEPVMEVVQLGLVYLDILAQQQGFAPVTNTDWNKID